MKIKHLKTLALTAVAALTLSACGNLSNVSDEGTTNNPVFPKISESVFNHDGSQFGSWVNWDNVRQIERGMNKDQLYNLIGRPHFAEGLYGVREWDYVFNYRENGEHKVCQYKVLFDKNMNAQQFYWYPNGCNGNASFNIDGDFLFDFDSANLTQNGRTVIAELAGKLIEMKADQVRVEGHTDRMGSEEYNLNLSQRRAENVSAELQSLGVTANITAVGLGKAHQVKHCEGNGQAAKDCLKPNRRVEVHASGRKVSADNTVNQAGPTGPTPLYEKGYPHQHNPYPTQPAKVFK